MAHIDAKEFAVFERIQRPAPIRVGDTTHLIISECLGQLPFQLRPWYWHRKRIHILHNGEEIRILHPQEIFPEEVAYTEQTRQPIENIRTFQGSDFVGPVWALKELAKKFPKVQQGRGRIR